MGRCSCVVANDDARHLLNVQFRRSLILHRPRQHVHTEKTGQATMPIAASQHAANRRQRLPRDVMIGDIDCRLSENRRRIPGRTTVARGIRVMLSAPGNRAGQEEAENAAKPISCFHQKLLQNRQVGYRLQADIYKAE